MLDFVSHHPGTPLCHVSNSEKYKSPPRYRLSSPYVNLYFSDRKIHHDIMTHVNISDFDTELRLFPLKCGSVLKMLRVSDGSLSNADARDISLYFKLSQLLCSLELLHLGNEILPTLSHLHLTVQGLQNQPDIPTKSRPEYLLSSSSERSEERLREKRNNGAGLDYGGAGGVGQQQGQGGLTLSVTANFYALQQKLMRELWLRNSRVISQLTINN